MSMETAKAITSIYLILGGLGVILGFGSLCVDKAIKRGGILLIIVNIVNGICALVIAGIGLQILSDGVHSVSALWALLAIAAGGFMFYFSNRKKENESRPETPLTQTNDCSGPPKPPLKSNEQSSLREVACSAPTTRAASSYSSHAKRPITHVIWHTLVILSLAISSFVNFGEVAVAHSAANKEFSCHFSIACLYACAAAISAFVGFKFLQGREHLTLLKAILWRIYSGIIFNVTHWIIFAIITQGWYAVDWTTSVTKALIFNCSLGVLALVVWGVKKSLKGSAQGLFVAEGYRATPTVNVTPLSETSTEDSQAIQTVTCAKKIAWSGESFSPLYWFCGLFLLVGLILGFLAIVLETAPAKSKVSIPVTTSVQSTEEQSSMSLVIEKQDMSEVRKQDEHDVEQTRLTQDLTEEVEWQQKAAQIMNGERLWYKDNYGRRYAIEPANENYFCSDAKLKTIVVNRVKMWAIGKHGERRILYKRVDDGTYCDFPESKKSDFLAWINMTGIRHSRVYERREGEGVFRYIDDKNQTFTVAESENAEFLADVQKHGMKVMCKPARQP